MINPFTGLEEDDLDMPIESADLMGPPVPVEAPIAPQPVVDPKEYIMKKYNLGPYGEEGRAAAVADTQLDWGDKASAALMALGAGLQGRDSGAAAASRLNQLQGQRNQRLDQFEKGRAGKIQEFGLDRDLTKAEREDKEYNDNNSETSELSKSYQEAAIKRGMSPEVASKLSAITLKQRLPFLEKEAETAFKEKEATRAQSNKDREFGMDKQKMGLEREKYEAGRTDESVKRDLALREFALREKIAGSNDENEKRRLQLQADEIARKRESIGSSKMTEGQKAVDKDYAKDYNDFTGGGNTKATDAINKLKDMRKTLAKENKEILGAGGGTFAGSLPDFMRDEQSIALRDNTISIANQALKATFGGQLSDGERKALANEFYNDKLSPEQNLQIMDRKISELEGALADQNKKAGYFQNKGSLSGFKSTPNEQKGKSDKKPVKKEFSKSRNQTRITYDDGTTEVVNGQQ